jgi:cell division protein ZapA
LERLVRFELLGQGYSFYTAASENEVAEAIALVQKAVTENISGQAGAIAVTKTAILTALNIASQHIALKMQYERYKRETEHRIRLLTQQIDSGLSAEKRKSEGEHSFSL